METKKIVGGSTNDTKQTYVFEDENSSEKGIYTSNGVAGSGTFGVVFQATVAETGETVAIKKVFQDKRYKNRELQILQTLNHPHVTTLKNAFHTPGKTPDEVYLNIVMDYIPQNLYQILRYYRKHKKTLPPILVKLYSYQLLRSIAYIHGIGICHRDIKPPNILIDPSTHMLKLCDFGSAKKLSPSEPNVSYICSRHYRAPELIFGATQYDCAIDVWSVGCVIAEMILLQPIFGGESALDQLAEIIKILGTPTQVQILQMNKNSEEVKLPKIKARPWNKVLKDDDPLLLDLISKILIYNPQERLKPAEALAHPYFDDLRQQSFQNQDCKIPDLFNFTPDELKGINSLVIETLTPSWKKNMN